MSDKQALIKNIISLIGAETSVSEVESKDESILNYIELRVQHLIDTDFQGLLQILYRLDVNENELKMNIEKTSPDKVPRLIAEMIFKREKQKLKTKEQYRQFKSDNIEDDEERW